LIRLPVEDPLVDNGIVLLAAFANIQYFPAEGVDEVLVGLWGYFLDSEMLTGFFLVGGRREPHAIFFDFFLEGDDVAGTLASEVHLAQIGLADLKLLVCIWFSVIEDQVFVGAESETFASAHFSLDGY
jgi:hypothetical protein